MACDLNQASEKYQELIETRKEQLDYIQQLTSTYEASQSGTWGKVKNVIINVLMEAGSSEIEDLLDTDVSFETLKNTISYIALVRPDAFGTVLAKEIDKLESFFKEEFNTIVILIDYIEEAIWELENNWTNLSSPNLKSMQQLELNELMNSVVPSVGNDLGSVKSVLIRLENDVYNHNTTEAMTSGTINSLISDLQDARNKLSDDGQDSVISNIIRLLMLWRKIEVALKSLRSPFSEEFTSIADFFEQVGENFKESINSMMGAMTLIREALSDLNNVDRMMFRDWEISVSSLLKNLNRYQGSDSLKTALDNYINTKINQPINVNYPVISTLVSESTFEKWEANANFAKMNKNTWITMIDKVINKMEQVKEKGQSTLLSYDDIYEPLTEDVIDAYIDISGPYWDALFRKFNEAYRIIELLTEGGEVTKDLVTVLNEFLSAAKTFKNIINTRMNTFETEQPKNALVTAMDLTHETTTMFSGVMMMADYLGLDHMSDLMNRADFGSIMNLSEEDADTTQQILNDLKCLEEASDITKSMGIEIRSLLVAERERKNRLQLDATKTLQEGIETEKEEIEEMEELNRKFKNNIQEV